MLRKEDMKKDMINNAQDKVKAILSRDDLYEIEPDLAKEIDSIVKKAEKFL